MFIYYFSKMHRIKMVPTPSATSTSSTKASTVPVMFIKIWYGTCLYTIFQRQFHLKQSQHDTGWSRCSRTTSATSPRSTIWSSASTFYVHQKLILRMFIFYFTMINRIEMVPRWSCCSLTPWATSRSSTMASIASNSYVNQNLTWHMFIRYFSKANRFKTVPEWYWLMKMLLDAHSDLVKVNLGEYSMY